MQKDQTEKQAPLNLCVKEKEKEMKNKWYINSSNQPRLEPYIIIIIKISDWRGIDQMGMFQPHIMQRLLIPKACYGQTCNSGAKEKEKVEMK